MRTMLILPLWKNTALRSPKNSTSILHGEQLSLMVQEAEPLASIQRSDMTLIGYMQTN